MVKFVAIVKPKEGSDPEEFWKYWLEVHAPRHINWPGLRKYCISRVTEVVGGDTDRMWGMAEEWSKLLYRTLKTKIAELGDDLVILPGHYMDWKEGNSSQIFSDMLGKIKNKNSDIYSLSNEADFIEYIKNHMRPQPEVYAEIRKVNAGLLEVDAEKQEIMDLGKNECAASPQKAS